ncbi:MAG TPA: acyl carrier protein [Candidatus Corynebacterium gallistercoris]|uniref:Acyl carrier protein n=1 Tax=Candidatus Corynebacterium gallistercoris TaxID=2838530 RepID=A0A9D1URH4_9CORY|nr:acyl carrier protein [Candidatus Corynebacterium gallistercoris]
MAADDTVNSDMKSKLAAALAGNTGDAATGAEDKGIRPASEDVHGNVLAEIESATGLDQEELAADKALGDDLGVDSLSLVDLSVRLEERFGVQLDQEVLPPEATVREIVTMVEAKLS